MKLYVYKGFDVVFLSNLSVDPLINNDIFQKKDIFSYDKKYKRRIAQALFNMDDDDEKWITYEEYTYAKEQIDVIIKDYELDVDILTNNIFPDYYPIEFSIDDSLLKEIIKSNDSSETNEAISQLHETFRSVYSSLIQVEGRLFACFYNYEYDKEDHVTKKEYYPHTLEPRDSLSSSEFTVFINEDVESYLKVFSAIDKNKPKSIGFKTTNGLAAKRIFDSLVAYCQLHHIELVRYSESFSDTSEEIDDLIDIAKNDIRIPNFTSFRNIKFYKNPDLSNETIDISQARIIRDIITQAENAYDTEIPNNYRDIFITAFTGAGKSVMFQIPAVYLAKKHQKLTIIIEPVKALMQDQKEQLLQRGYNRVETFNSDLISQEEKEAVLKRVKDGEIDLLYLSPETLLSYSIETLIGDREIGLLIVDEAHIVTTWGVGFRPDYWYLGSYINTIRNGVQTSYQKGRHLQKFPICAFTATAINGGLDDSVSETIISLYMENPIKYIGYAKRDNIEFRITKKESKKLPNAVYEKQKAESFASSIQSCIEKGEKTIVYFPYATYARDAYKGIKSFSGTQIDRTKIGLYTGGNTEALSAEDFKNAKQEAFEKFRSGENTVMFATKAFGMGVDINDIINVYHYAVTGNLSDYVQEIGRAARKHSLKGVALTDYYYNDLSFMQRLFGMSQIKQYQINLVLSGVYNTFKSKKCERNFLISPEAFTYIFNGKSDQKEDNIAINKLKTCLLMLEKDLCDKYTFKVLISRPQSVFTKAYVVIQKEYTDKVLQSKYGNSFEFIATGRQKELQKDGGTITDVGDVYRIDLKSVWEKFYPNISFPRFKFCYFSKNNVEEKYRIMKEISEYIFPRQKITIETKHDLLLCDLRDLILQDFEYIADTMYEKYRKTYFTKDDFANLISSKYGKTRARIISNSLFSLIDPEGKCVKHRINEDTNTNTYILSNGIFKELLKKPIAKSGLLKSFTDNHNSSFSRFLSINSSDHNSIALRLLSVFDYITYEVLGGEEPEIFIRLNDPEKIRRIVTNEISYSNSYVTKARQKHDRDVKILSKFFYDLKDNEERWDYIEQYFLGADLLNVESAAEEKAVPLASSIDREKSYPTNQFSSWKEMEFLFEENIQPIITSFNIKGIPLPEYLQTKIKRNIVSGEILLSWPSKNILMFSESISNEDLALCKAKGWRAFCIFDLDIDEFKEAF